MLQPKPWLLPSFGPASGDEPGQLLSGGELLLECRGEPWVFARSVMPAATLRERLRHLRRFGERSLGALLFSSRGLRREPFEVALVRAAHGILPAAPAAREALWGRRSVFRVHGSPLLVAEFFLPACRLGPV